MSAPSSRKAHTPPSGPGAPTCADFNFDWNFDGIDESISKDSGGSLSLTDGKFVFVAKPSDYDDGTYKPGVYTVTVAGRVKKADPVQEKEITFDITLLDPCDPPASVKTPEYADQVYELTETAQILNKVDFTASRG